jgi:hypothetical protein
MVPYVLQEDVALQNGETIAFTEEQKLLITRGIARKDLCKKLCVKNRGRKHHGHFG